MWKIKVKETINLPNKVYFSGETIITEFEKTSLAKFIESGDVLLLEQMASESNNNTIQTEIERLKQNQANVLNLPSVQSLLSSYDQQIADLSTKTTNAMTRANSAMTKANTADTKAESAMLRDMVPGPKGDKGDTGSAGTQGSTGIQGPKGDTGPSGKDGVNATTTTNATTSAAGLMSAADKSKLDSIDAGKIITKTHDQTLPAIILGGTYSFDIPVPGASAAMGATVNCTTSLGFGTVLDPVTGTDKVTVYIKAGVAILAGTRTFNVRVIK